MKFFIFILSLFCADLACAQTLTLTDLLLSVKNTFPILLSLEQEITAAEGEQRSALGEFDLKWKTKSTFMNAGYYRNQRIESVVEKPTSIWGMNVYGGYREGDGKFAVYDGKYETTPGGEVHMGFGLPLLRDREIDQRRASLKNAELGIDLASMEVEIKKIQIALKSADKYWSWVAYGLKEKIAADLLETAKSRIKGLKERVRVGDVAEIELKDNERTVLQREAQLVKATRALQSGQIELSLYLRDQTGSAILPNKNRLPEKISHPKPVSFVIDDLVKEAQERRPEIRALKIQRDKLRVDNKLSDNQLNPKLDLFMEVSKDVGSGNNTKEPTELESGVLLEIPLQRRKAEGKIISNDAKIKKINQEIEFYTSRIKADIQDAISALENAQRQSEIVKEELKIAKEVEAGERDKFMAGESTILVVNLRELATADTAVKYVDSLSEYKVAEAMLKAALGKSWDN